MTIIKYTLKYVIIITSFHDVQQVVRYFGLIKMNSFATAIIRHNPFNIEQGHLIKKISYF